MDSVEAQGRSHETRLLFLEAHVKVVLRGESRRCRSF